MKRKAAKRKPKALVISPGRYRTRDGGYATVESYHPDEDEWIWQGTSNNYKGSVTWNKNGRGCYNPKKHWPDDLIERLPDDKPKAQEVKWGIWIPFNSRAIAVSALNKVNGLSAHFKSSGAAEVRRLPKAGR